MLISDAIREGLLREAQELGVPNVRNEKLREAASRNAAAEILEGKIESPPNSIAEWNDRRTQGG